MNAAEYCKTKQWTLTKTWNEHRYTIYDIPSHVVATRSNQLFSSYDLSEVYDYLNLKNAYIRDMITKIISGGQTGADRAGLEAGRILGIETGGTAPKNWRTETGADASLRNYGLVEHESSDYPPRTEDNVKNSDATIIFDLAKKFAPGSALTIKLCKAYNKPYLLIKRIDDLLIAENISQFLLSYKVRILNVAGNRESSAPGIFEKVKNVLIESIPCLKNDSDRIESPQAPLPRPSQRA